MVSEGNKVAAPRAINVQKYAESRALELHSLQSIISNRVNGDYRSQRNKRRRTTAFNNQIARRKKNTKKRQKLGIVLEKKEEEQMKNLPRRVRRRYELKMNPVNGFCTCGDGTKRLRTHVWHAKRFSMTKLWGYYLPLGLHGRRVTFSIRLCKSHSIGVFGFTVKFIFISFYDKLIAIS